MNISDMLLDGLKYMGVGIGIVFAALGLFYGIIKLLLKIWPPKEEA